MQGAVDVDTQMLFLGREGGQNETEAKSRTRPRLKRAIRDRRDMIPSILDDVSMMWGRPASSEGTIHPLTQP
jgi:hypothetical protein